MNLLKFKIENLLAVFYIPIGIINIAKADAGLLFTAIILQASLIAVLHYGIKTTRKDLIKSILAGDFEEEIEQIKNAIATFRSLKKTIAINTKKEVIGSKLRTTKLKDAF